MFENQGTVRTSSTNTVMMMMMMITYLQLESDKLNLVERQTTVMSTHYTQYNIC